MYDLPLLFSSLENKKRWRSVEVTFHLSPTKSDYNIQTNGPFLFFISIDKKHSFALFSPNYTPISDHVNKTVLYLQCVSLPSIKHTLVFKQQSLRDFFLNYVFEANGSLEELIMNADIVDYLLNDQIQGVIYPHKTLAQVIVSMQVQMQHMMFQAHIVNKGNIELGLNIIFSHNTVISTFFEIPAALKKEKNVEMRTFGLISAQKPEEISVFLLRNEEEMIKWVLSLHTMLIFSQKYKLIQQRKLMQKDCLEDTSSFIEILDKTNLFNANKKERKILKFIRTEPPEKEETFNISTINIPNDKLNNIKLKKSNEDLDFLIPQDSENHFDLLFEIKKNSLDNIDKEFNLNSNLSDFGFDNITDDISCAIINGLKENISKQQFIEIIHSLLLNGIYSNYNALELFQFISNMPSFHDKDNLIIILNRVQSNEDKSKIFKIIEGCIDYNILSYLLQYIKNTNEVTKKFYSSYSIIQNNSLINQIIDLVHLKENTFNSHISTPTFFESISQPLSFLDIDNLGKTSNSIALIEQILNQGIIFDNAFNTHGAWRVFRDILELNKTNSSDIINKATQKFKDELNHLSYIIEIIQQNNYIRLYPTLLQELINFGIGENKLHIWILIASSFKDIIRKYFSPDSTLYDNYRAAYVANAIYHYIN